MFLFKMDAARFTNASNQLFHPEPGPHFVAVNYFGEIPKK